MKFIICIIYGTSNYLISKNFTPDRCILLHLLPLTKAHQPDRKTTWPDEYFVCKKLAKIINKRKDAWTIKVQSDLLPVSVVLKKICAIE